MTTPYRYSAVYALSADIPVITTQPVDATVASGSTTTFTVVATGTSTLTYQWYTGTSGSTGAPISGATSASYTTPALSASGTYWVRVTSSGGIADSRTTTATVVAPAPSVGPGGGDLVVEWWAIPSSGSPYLIFDVTDWTISEEGGSRGTVSVTYPAAGPLYATLVAATIGADRDLEVEIRVSEVGATTAVRRALLTDSEVDEVSEVKARTFRGPLIGQLLNEAVLYNNGASSDGSTSFSNVSPGAIVSSLVATAQARGALAGISVASFSSSVDSTGLAWPTLQTITLSPGGTLLSVLRELEDAGVLEWELATSGSTRSLRLYAPGRMGVDRTIVSPPLVLRSGRDITAAPRKHSVSNAVTALLVSGSGGNYVDVSDSSALARRGRRIEGYVSAAGISSTTGLGIFGNSQLAQKSAGTLELEHTLVLADPTSPKPFIDYGLRDLVYSDTLGAGESVRIQQIVLQRTGAEVTARVVVGNLIAERLAALARKLERLANGTAVIGSSTPTGPLSNDTIAPNAPTGLALGTGAQPDGLGGSIAAVFATWAAPLTNTDGSVCNDIASYELTWRYITAGYSTGQNPVAGVNGLQTDFGGLAVGVIVAVAVRAVDRAGNRSAFCTEVQITTGTDSTPPPTPSTPIVLAGLGDQIEVRWNGLGSAGETMPPDFDHVDVHLSTTSGFTPTTGTRRDQFRGKQALVINGLTYGNTYYIALIAYDRSGNPSAASAQGAAVPTRLIGDDLTDGLVTAAKLGSQAVTTPKIFPEAVTTPHLSVAAFADGALPNQGFEDVDLTTSTLPARWSLLSSTGSTPTYSRDTTASHVASGAAALKISLPAASGSARIGSDVIACRPGEIYYLQVPAHASRAVSSALKVRAYVDVNNPPVPANSGVDNAVGTILSLTTSYPATPSEFNFTVPATVGAGAPRYIRFVLEAGLVSGDGAALDVWTDELRLRKVVGQAEIANASIGNAQIINATIQDAKIANVAIGKLIAGSLTAAMILSTGVIATGVSGDFRFEATSAGWRLVRDDDSTSVEAKSSTGDLIFYRSDGIGGQIRTMQFFASNGDFIMYKADGSTAALKLTGSTGQIDTVGTIKTNITGDRIELTSATGYPTIFFFDSSTSVSTDKAYINAVQIAGGGSGSTSGTGIGLGINSGPYVGGIQTTLFLQPNALYLGRNLIGSNTKRGGYVELDSNSIRIANTGATGSTDLASVLVSGTTVQLSGVGLFMPPGTPIVGSAGTSSSARFGMDGAPTSVYLIYNSGSPQWVRHDTNAVIKTFVADHPLDPARHLVHATVEGPAVTNLYTGTARLIRGRAVVELPGYFEAANRREGRVVVLTPMLDDSERVAVVAASYPRDGRFTIRAMGPDCDVSWLVTAVRADVPHLDPEPLRAGNRVRGDGPYTYLVPTGAP